MPERLRLYTLRTGRLPSCIGLCREDIAQLAQAVNTAQRRLILCRESGDEGWYGTWAEMEFAVDPANPYITTPREVARIETMTVCDDPVGIQNQFYQYLQFGNGTLPKTCRADGGCGILQTYTKNNVALFVDPPVSPFLIRAYISNPSDVNRRVLIGGKDQNGKTVYTLDQFNQVQGQFMPLASPFVTWPQQFSSIAAVQKDVTLGEVQIFTVDPATGDETLVLTMQPGEKVAWYRRYYLNPIPAHCCNSTAATVAVKAIVKLEPIDVAVDTDFLVIQNQEAIIEECASVRYSEMDSGNAKQMAAERHIQAIRFLNGELTHYLGTNAPAIEFAPFGSARLERVNIGMM